MSLYVCLFEAAETVEHLFEVVEVDVFRLAETHPGKVVLFALDRLVVPDALFYLGAVSPVG
ncbi:MAG: hypothetical protein IJ241_01230, partial [Clostridia bacterium]|nr:hypothetical protein [Clostridia bacterium]